MPVDSAAAPSERSSVEPALHAVLQGATVRVRVDMPTARQGSWTLDQPRRTCGMFHLVGQGHCVVEIVPSRQRVPLTKGDLVLLPRGTAHCLRGADRCPDTSPGTRLIGGEMQLHGPGATTLINALPRCLVVRAKDAGEAFGQLTRMLQQVAATDDPSRQLLLDKLADALFTLAICDYATRASHRHGLFAGIADERLGKVLQAVHDEPGEVWTMQRMAAIACMSRSTFAERFTTLMKMPPLRYVTQWRVDAAERLLADRSLSVAHIAEQLGYSSEAAFRRLFKRVNGTSPGRVRALTGDGRRGFVPGDFARECAATKSRNLAECVR